MALGLARWPRADLEALALEIIVGEPELSFPTLEDISIRHRLSCSGLALEIQYALQELEALALDGDD